jgi:hypothetical protein
VLTAGIANIRFAQLSLGSAFFARPDYRMKIGKGYGGDIARMQMWRGVKSAEEIAKLAKAAHGRVVVEEAKKE